MCLLLLFPQPSAGLFNDHQGSAAPTCPGLQVCGLCVPPSWDCSRGFFPGSGCRGKELTIFSVGAPLSLPGKGKAA